jgi:hypothetical protein
MITACSAKKLYSNMTTKLERGSATVYDQARLTPSKS